MNQNQNFIQVANTSRQRLINDNGTVIDRQFIYLHPHTWNKLRKLSMLHGTSGSLMIERLINQQVIPTKETLVELQKQAKLKREQKVLINQ